MLVRNTRGAGKPVRNRHGPATVTGEYVVEQDATDERDVGKADGAR